MADINGELLVLVVVAGLIIFTGMGIFIGMRISSGRRRVRALEKELSRTRRDMEAYRSQVNMHFKKTSELFTQMTNSYKAIYVHLAEGSQELFSTDAARLKSANAEFLKVTHEERKPDVEKPPAETAGHDTDKEDDSPAAAASRRIPGQEETEQPELAGTGPDDNLQQEEKDEPGQLKQEPEGEETKEQERAAAAGAPPEAEEKKET